MTTSEIRYGKARVTFYRLGGAVPPLAASVDIDVFGERFHLLVAGFRNSLFGGLDVDHARLVAILDDLERVVAAGDQLVEPRARHGRTDV